MRLIFATNNQHKLKEIVTSVSDKYEVLGLKDVNIDEEIDMMLEDLIPHKNRISMFSDSIIKKISWKSELLTKQQIEITR